MSSDENVVHVGVGGSLQQAQRQIPTSRRRGDRIQVTFVCAVRYVGRREDNFRDARTVAEILAAKRKLFGYWEMNLRLCFTPLLPVG